jgi:C-terminal processing protease CtpA/Prc
VSSHPKEVVVELSIRRLLSVWTVAVALAALLAVAPRAHADPLPDRTERVIGLGRVWAKAKFFHPYLAYKDLDWDAALVAAIPKAEAATTVAEYRAAVQGMLAALGDPVTRVIDVPAADAAKPGPAPTDWLTTPAPGILAIQVAGLVTDGFDPVGIRAKGAQVVTEAAKAKLLIVDLRLPAARAGFGGYAVTQILDALPAIDDWPLERSLEHHGYRTQEGQTSGGYFSTFVTTGAQPAKPGAKPGVSQVVFVVDQDSALPGAALALQAAGHATIVAQGPINEDSVVTTLNVELPGSLTAQLRLGELLWGPPAADVTVARNQDLGARALAVARTLAAAPARPRPRKLLALPPLRARNDLDYADQPYPPRERRMLAGIRLWAVLDRFFPYRYLIADWDSALRDALPRLADAADRDGYRRVLRQMSVRAGDGHIGVRPAAPDPAARPRGSPAIATRLVEGKLAVVRLIDEAEARQQGLAVGDVIETIDGKPAATALADARPETSGSTDEARDQRAAGALLAGDDGSSVKLGVRGAGGKLRDVTLTRTAANLTAMWAKSAAPHWKQLPGNIGYADLRELMVPEVGPMFDDLKATRAIVFDMRGYPNGTAWSIAPRVNTRKAAYGAQFLQPLVSGADGEEADLRIRFLQTLPKLAKDAAIYAGKIVVLIDDRAISQAEHTCLFLASAAGATFIGSPTHGANGDVTLMRLPGGLRMSFTGQEVRHVDGRQLQKVGIQPDVVVRPTLAGLRAGKDEVLDRALAWLAANR